MTVSSAYLITEQLEFVMLQSLVYSENRIGEITQPCGAPTGIQVQTLYSRLYKIPLDPLWSVNNEIMNNHGKSGCIIQITQFFYQQVRYNGIEGTREIDEYRSDIALWSIQMLIDTLKKNKNRIFDTSVIRTDQRY